MKLTQSKKVREIVRPLIEGLPDWPVVVMNDSLMRAVELMLKNDLKAIGVITSGRRIGHIRLEEALECLGLRLPIHCPPHGNASQTE
jgi:hypothetical protein